jgi:hypothetical protein
MSELGPACGRQARLHRLRVAAVAEQGRTGRFFGFVDFWIEEFKEIYLSFNPYHPNSDFFRGN